MTFDDQSLNDSITSLVNLSLELEQDVRDDGDDFEQLTGQMIPAREDQVLNNAGGYVFEVSDQMRIRRFLILGTNGGTYYVNQSTLKEECIEDLIRIIKDGRGHLILREIFDITKDNRAPKKDYSLYALALAARFETKDWAALYREKKMTKYDEYISNLQNAAFKLVPHVCKIATNLFMFIDYAEKISKEYNQKTGWGRQMRGAIANWYLKRQPKTLALQLTKYRNRCGYTHRDVLRLSHADPQSLQKRDNKDAILYDYLFHYAVTGKLNKDFGDRYMDEQVENLQSSDVAKFLQAVVKASKLDTKSEDECAQLIRENQLVREHIPTDLLNSATVWKSLLQRMPMTAMIRNLSKMSVLDLITGENPDNQKWVDLVVENLTNEQKIKKAGIHPFSVLLAKSVYAQGSGIRGKLEFKTNPVILDALEKAFLLAFKNVKPTNKRFLLALDVSGSMGSSVSGSVISCRDAAIAMSMVALRTEPNTEVVGFSGNLAHIPVNQDTSFKEFFDKIYCLSFDSTDCSLPMIWAKKEKKEFDCFVVYTDCETYFGDVHPFEALKQYREASGIKDAKLIVVAFTGTRFTIADPSDPGMLDVVGFDSAAPQLMAEFVSGRL